MQKVVHFHEPYSLINLNDRNFHYNKVYDMSNLNMAECEVNRYLYNMSV